MRNIGLTKDAVDASFIAAAFGFVRKEPRNVKGADVIKKLARLGIDPNPALDALCSAATTGSESVDPLTIAAELNPNHPCIARVRSARTRANFALAARTGLWLAVGLVPLGFAVLLARRRLVPVRAQLAKENAEFEAVRAQASVSARLEGKSGDDSISAAIADATRWLGEADESAPRDEQAATAGRALAALTPEKRAALIARTRLLIAHTGTSGVVGTCLCELGNVILYLACFPGREDQPRTVRRQPAFGDGWTAHMRGILDACTSAGDSRSVASFVFILGIDGRRMTMLTAYDSATLQLVPKALADLSQSGGDEPTNDGAQVHERRAARTHAHRYEF